MFESGYIVTFVSGVVGVHLQSQIQQEKYELMKDQLNKYWFSMKPKPISDIFTGEDKIYCVSSDSNVFRGKIVGEAKNLLPHKGFLCIDVDLGQTFYTMIDKLYDLPEGFRVVDPLSTYRQLKNITMSSNYKVEDLKKIHDYIYESLRGKYITVENPCDYNVNIYDNNEYLNPKLSRGIQALFNETTIHFARQQKYSIPTWITQKYDINDNTSSLYDIPAPKGRSMDILGKSIYSPNMSSQAKESNYLNYGSKNNLMTMENLIRENFMKRQKNSECIAVDSAFSKASQYILIHSSFHSEVDDLLSKGRELLHKKTFALSNGVNKVEQLLAIFYNKKHQFNILEAKNSLKEINLNLSGTYTHEEIVSAREEISKRELSDLEQSFYTFIKEFDRWKSEYAECQAKTDVLLKVFINKQREFLNWSEQVIQGNADFSRRLSFDSTQILYDQLKNEERLAMKENMTTIAVLLLSDEIEGRLKKISSFTSISAEIDNRSQDCSYQKNKKFSNESGVPLLSFLKLPNGIFSAETKCLFICDIYRELVSLHQKGMVYKMLNPTNINIIDQGNAILLVPIQSDLFEQFPPWQFIAPECRQQNYAVTSAADIYSLGQFILWMACVDVTKNFEERISSIKTSCPILEMSLITAPQLRPSLLTIGKSFSTIFPEVFGVMFSENLKMTVLKPPEEAHKSIFPSPQVPNENQMQVLKTDQNLVQQNTSKAPPKNLPNGISFEDMKYELSLMRELQDSDSEEVDLEDDFNSMVNITYR